MIAMIVGYGIFLEARRLEEITSGRLAYLADHSLRSPAESLTWQAYRRDPYPGGFSAQYDNIDFHERIYRRDE